MLHRLCILCNAKTHERDIGSVDHTYDCMMTRVLIYEAFDEKNCCCHYTQTAGITTFTLQSITQIYFILTVKYIMSTPTSSSEMQIPHKFDPIYKVNGGPGRPVFTIREYQDFRQQYEAFIDPSQGRATIKSLFWRHFYNGARATRRLR
jgi:hypothetical protein